MHRLCKNTRFSDVYTQKTTAPRGRDGRNALGELVVRRVGRVAIQGVPHTGLVLKDDIGEDVDLTVLVLVGDIDDTDGVGDGAGFLVGVIDVLGLHVNGALAVHVLQIGHAT